MAEININDIAAQAVPFLTFTDSGGASVAGSSLSVATIRQPDLSQASVNVVAVNWTNTNPVSLTPNYVVTANYTNKSMVAQSQTFAYQYADTHTHTWTVSDTFAFGVSVKAKANLAIASADVTVSFTFTLALTNTVTDTTTEMDTVTFPLQVPPESIVTASWVVQQLDNVTLPFTATFEVTGMITLSVLAITGEYTWTGTAGQLIAAAIMGGAGGWNVKGDAADRNFTGTLVADQGVTTQVIVTQKNLDGSVMATSIHPQSLFARRTRIMSQTLLASVISGAQPQQGQEHRSSGNFSTENAPAGTTNLNWKIVPLDEGFDPAAIKFDIMRDVSILHDPKVWINVTNDSTGNYQSSRSYYVANPQGSGPSGFNVLVYAVK